MAALSAKPTSPSLTLPPAYRQVPMSETGDALEDAHGYAYRIAAREGAGAFVCAGRSDVLDFAVVLEPDEPLVTARRAVFAGMAAIADALASFVPPEKSITFTFPTTIHVDGGRLGGGRLAWPDGCAEDEVPDWLVFSGMLLAMPEGVVEPGTHPDATWLTEEGFDPAEIEEVVASFARHLMVAFDAWAERGFTAVAETYLARLPKEVGEGRRGIDQNGDLLLHRKGGFERVPLLAPLMEAAWYDPETRLPRL